MSVTVVVGMHHPKLAVYALQKALKKGISTSVIAQNLPVLTKSLHFSPSLELIALDAAISTRVGQPILLNSAVFGLSFEEISPSGTVVTASGSLIRL